MIPALSRDVFGYILEFIPAHEIMHWPIKMVMYHFDKKIYFEYHRLLSKWQRTERNIRTNGQMFMLCFPFLFACIFCLSPATCCISRETSNKLRINSSLTLIYERLNVFVRDNFDGGLPAIVLVLANVYIASYTRFKGDEIRRSIIRILVLLQGHKEIKTWINKIGLQELADDYAIAVLEDQQCEQL